MVYWHRTNCFSNSSCIFSCPSTDTPCDQEEEQYHTLSPPSQLALPPTYTVCHDKMNSSSFAVLHHILPEFRLVVRSGDVTIAVVTTHTVMRVKGLTGRGKGIQFEIRPILWIYRGEGGRERGREGGSDGGRERGREGERERGRE